MILYKRHVPHQAGDNQAYVYPKHAQTMTTSELHPNFEIQTHFLDPKSKTSEFHNLDTIQIFIF